MVLVKLLSDPSKLSGFEGSDRDAGAGPLAPPEGHAVASLNR